MASALNALAEVPRSIALPAAAASLAYLNARSGFTQDAWFIRMLLAFQLRVTTLEKQDRINVFYVLENHARNPQTARRAFLAIPADSSEPKQQTEWTYAEAYDAVLKYARWLKDMHGVQKNEIVAMDITNKPLFIWLWFAIWSLGAKPAFINTNLRSNGFVHCVRVSSARLLLIDSQIREVLNDETKTELGADGRGRSIDAFIIEPSLEADILRGSSYRAPNDVRSGELVTSMAMLIYTSGTTGLPKAAVVNWGKPLSGIIFWWRLVGLRPNDRFFTSLPLYHSAATVTGLCQPLGGGCTVVIPPRFSPRNFMRQATETKATAMQYIGELCRYLIATPSSPFDRKHSIRVAFGNGMRPDVWQKFKDRFGIPTIVEFYGSTEGPGASMVYECNGFLRGAIGRSGWVSRLLLGSTSVLVKYDHAVDMPLRNPKTGFCIKCANNEPGELLHPLQPDKIGEQFFGYQGNKKASTSKVLRNVFKKGDAYYRSGDLQRMDSDGRWWFVDRVGDTFRWKSENVSTAEVSEALGSHLAIKEANVYGVELPNHDGRAGCAALSLIDGQTLDDNLRRELAALARQRLPRYAVPLFLRVSKELEVTGTMKHQKVALRNAGVDPSKTEGDELFWLQPGSDTYEPFGQSEWQRLVAGSAKL